MNRYVSVPFFKVLMTMLFCLSSYGCALSWTKEHSGKGEFEAARSHDVHWLSDNTQSISEIIYDEVKDEYPKSQYQLPKLTIGKVSIPSQDKDMIYEITQIFNNVLNQLTTTEQEKPTWIVDYEITYLKEKHDDLGVLADSAAIAYGLVCWRVVFVVCPVWGNDTIVFLNATVTSHDGKVINLQSYGAADFFTTSNIVLLDSEFKNKARAKALAAAVRSFTLQFVDRINSGILEQK
ncbi:hypothetical protein [Pleionea sediminis]|uniref:hypothetical protein n=1 Tax=Pleionea sediminis TaxID=2569479 RepID=UPI001185008A|nr:hypothetical protein [Pleionea sediminis]